MATRTIKTTDEVDAALEFLGKSSLPPVSGDDYFLSKLQYLIDEASKLADSQRFDLIKAALDDADKTSSLNKLREILNVK